MSRPPSQHGFVAKVSTDRTKLPREVAPVYGVNNESSALGFLAFGYARDGCRRVDSHGSLLHHGERIFSSSFVQFVD